MYKLCAMHHVMFFFGDAQFALLTYIPHLNVNVNISLTRDTLKHQVDHVII